MGIRPTRFGSRRLLAAALLSSMALVVVSSHDAQAGPPPIPIKPPQESQKSLTPEVKTPAEVTKPPVPGGMKPCADLAAQRIDFGIVSKTSQFKGRVRITGVVKNISPVAYSGTLTLNLFQKVSALQARSSLISISLRARR
ncbi:MAG: hypothetical protein M5R38_17150 [Candidatus Methylomirabilis sp.]|nr:hypothetical protein [Candidatus Methylomirabilis sp.]